LNFPSPYYNTKEEIQEFFMVPDGFNFSRPPVCEGLIDIRIQPLSLEALPIIEELHTHFSSRFPNKQTQYEISSSLKIEENKVTTKIKTPNPLGYLFESLDKKKLVQFRRDGFTFNQLKPDPDESWPGWESIKSEARELWDLYSQAMNFDNVERLALRYINKIVLKGKSGTGIDLDDYLTAAPQIPSPLPQTLTNYFTRVEFPFPKVNGWGIIIMTPHPEKSSNTIKITLDIEVFQRKTMPLDNDLIWPSLDQFRDAKNEIFDASLTKKAKELFK
jgi:uncharacterized protein (TIGR04255 family)